MQNLGDKRVISASDLNDRLACWHLLRLNLQRAMGDLKEDPKASATGGLLSAKGDLHDAGYLERLRAEGLEVVELSIPEESTIAGLEQAAAKTAEAMSEEPDVIFQATFFDGERSTNVERF